jgi:hypothetical protein
VKFVIHLEFEVLHFGFDRFQILLLSNASLLGRLCLLEWGCALSPVCSLVFNILYLAKQGDVLSGQFANIVSVLAFQILVLLFVLCIRLLFSTILHLELQLPNLRL